MYHLRGPSLLTLPIAGKIADCRWKQVAGSNALTSSALEYAWHHKDVWTYERHGTLEAHGSYNVECETTNRLRLPTNFR
jgi:hypothetical protein